MLKLRQYQSEIIDATRQSLRTNRNVLIQAPTGAGKTVMATFMAGNTLRRNKRLYFICHRQELLKQTAKTFSKNDLPVSFIAAGKTYNPTSKIQICSIDTLKNRHDKLPDPDVAIWDEAHHLGAAGWSRVHAAYGGSYHIGLSATPQRLDGKGLGEWFDDLIIKVSTADLIKEGSLSDYRIFAPSKPDMSGVKVRMGDFNQTEMQNVMDNAHVTGDIIKHWRRYAPGKKTIMFAINIEHSMHLVEMFNQAGIPAAHLDGNTPRGEREQICYDFAVGKYQVLSNVMLFGEGFDLAAQTDIDVTIEAMICARPTMSLSLWLQMCGRALRKKDYDAIILDHAGNASRHGLPCQEREWTLQGDPNQGRRKKPDVPIKECPRCYAVHRPLPKCPVCGHIYEVSEREIVTAEGELVELSKEQLRRNRAREQSNAQSIDALIALGKKRGYKNPMKWAAHVYTARQAKARQA